jgi:chitinase
MAEGNAGQSAFRFIISLDRAQSSPVTVGFATANGTATAPSDYTAASGTVTFAPGETAKPVTVEVNGDTTVEPDETFGVNLTNATANATIADGQAMGTIVNDDQAVTLPPVVTGVSPKSGPISGGTRITITGTGFARGDTVVIGQGNGPGAGAIAATTVSVVSSTQITATTGGGARPGTWNLFVIAPNGTASRAVSGDQFTYIATAAGVSTVTHNSGSTGGGTAITITGSRFARGAHGRHRAGQRPRERIGRSSLKSQA